jgi:hypothetical protein
MSRLKLSKRSLIAAAALAGLSAALSLTACTSRPAAKAPLESLFAEGRAVFYGAVAADVDRHPERGRLKASERTKIAGLQSVYPRLYAILMNYYYQKEAPVFSSLLDEAGPESMRRFREKYLELARFASRMFVDSLFKASPSGFYFQDFIPRFKDKDSIDLVAMATGHQANIDLPAADKIVSKSLSPEFEKQWGLAAARFREAHRITKGKGVRVAVLDTGIDMSHPVFRDTAWGRHFNFVGRDGFPWLASGPPMVDWGWHGTVVTSIVAKYAPEAQITVYRYMDGDTQNDSPLPIVVSSIMGAGIYKAVHDGNDIINISAGTSIHVPYLQEACQYAYDNNVLIVTGSPYYQGRYLGGAEDYPGQYPTTVAVTAVDRLAENKYGYWPVASPETTTAVGAPAAPFVAYPAYTGETDNYAPGISCATPIVASLAALVESIYPRLGTEAPGLYIETIRKLIQENANPRLVGFDGFSPECGYGMIDAAKTVEAALRMQAARPVHDPASAVLSSATASDADVVFIEGRTIFHAELKLALGLHPERNRLRIPEISKIEAGAEGLPFLYETLLNILCCGQESRLLELRGQNDLAPLRDLYFGLCREAADRFVQSLFTESPATPALLEAAENRGRGRLDIVLLSLGLGAGNGHAPDFPKRLDPAGLDNSRAMGLAKFASSRKSGSGQGIKLAVIDSGYDRGLDALNNAKLDHTADFSLIGRTRAPWIAEKIPAADGDGRGTVMAWIASWCAPGSEVRTYRISVARNQPYEYWPALELARALTKAADEGCDIIVTGAAFSRDFPFLKEACMAAYLRNVVIIAPNGLIRPGAPEETPSYPAAYNSVIAAAGADDASGPVLRPWRLSAPAKETAVTAPAFIGPGVPPSNAYAAGACGGLAALVSARLPKTGKELPGQYVQRIAEILKMSADPKVLGFRTFNTRIGYGLIDAEKTVGEGLRTYIEKMNALDENFKKRMARRAEMAAEAAKLEADMKQSAAGKK